jgi:peptide/nickel transport system substrate-binding protein
MSFFTRGRSIYWIIKDLISKYTRSLALGFFIGFIFSLIFWRIYPVIIRPIALPVERIGIVGVFSPSTLPQSIQKLASLGLTSIRDDGSVEPSLAKSWESTESGKVFTFHLQDPLVWQDGSKFTATDVNYNIRDVDIKAIDDTNVQAILKNPYGPFPALVAKPLFKKGFIGLGKFRVCCVNLKGDALLSLRLNPIDSDMNSKVKEYHFYQTEALAIMAYKLGEIDRIEEINNPKELIGWGNTRIEESVRYNRIVTLFFNLKYGPLGEKNYRQALAYAIPVLSEDRAYQSIPKTSWAYTDNVRKYSPDPVQVKKLLTQAKIGTESAQLTISTFSQYLDDAQAIANNWNSQGIPASVRVENSVSPTYQVLLTAIDVPPDPDQYPFWHSTQTVTNISNYVNVKIDKLLEDGRQLQDKDSRKKIYADFARRLVDDTPAVFLYYPKTYTVIRGK